MKTQTLDHLLFVQMAIPYGSFQCPTRFTSEDASEMFSDSLKAGSLQRRRLNCETVPSLHLLSASLTFHYGMPGLEGAMRAICVTGLQTCVRGTLFPKAVFRIASP